MSIQIVRLENAVVLRNPGKDSVQLLRPENAPDATSAVTRVTMLPGTISRRHIHPRSEQIWWVERGEATLLSDDGTTTIRAGDLVRTPPREARGVKNESADPFVYLSVTTPPGDFSGDCSTRVSPIT